MLYSPSIWRFLVLTRWSSAPLNTVTHPHECSGNSLPRHPRGFHPDCCLDDHYRSTLDGPLNNAPEPRLVPLSVSMSGRSDVGRVRSRNEDSLVLLPQTHALIVADGMGGHPGGDVASRLAAESLAATVQDVMDGMPMSVDRMHDAVLAAHQAIRDEGHRDHALSGMGTTLTGLHAAADRFVIGHVGDSRAYQHRNEETIQLTRDDTWVQDRVEEGVLSEGQARKHPFGHMLTQCLGLMQPPTPHVVEGDLLAGDLYLLCSDGLTGLVDDGRIHMVLRHVTDGTHTAREACESLISEANLAGGHDNITVGILQVGASVD